MKEINKHKITYYFLTVIIGILFFGLIGEDGVVLTKDSAGFIGTYGILPAGYVIYPAFVRFFVRIFGEEFGLVLVSVVQSMLAYSTSMYIASWIGKRFRLSYIVTMFCFLLCLLPYGYTLPEYVVTHEIMTEGIAIPIFNMLLVLLLRWSLDREKKILLSVFPLMIMLVLTRPQLLTIFAAIIFVLMLELIKDFLPKRNKQNKWTLYALAVAICVGVLLSVRPIMMCVMEIMPQFSHAVSGKVLSTMEETDRNYFSDVEQDAFDYVYNKVDEKKHRTEYMRTDVYRSDDIIVAINDNTKFHLSYFHEFCLGKEKELQTNLSEIDIKNNVINTLFIENFGRYLGLASQLLPYSFVASIFIQPDAIKGLCHVVTAILYLLAIAIYVKARKKAITSTCTRPFEIVMSILLINVVLTNIVFYAQQRYVIYTFGWFYIVVLLMLIGLYRNKKEAGDLRT